MNFDSGVASYVVYTDATLSGNGTAISPLHVVGGGTPVKNEVMGGVVNGTNKTFTLANTPTLNTESIYNEGGQRLRPTVDYTITGLTVTLNDAPINLAPLADYNY